MALSDYERKMLAQLEEQLSGEDPKLVQALASEEEPEMSLGISPKNLVLGLIIAVLGLGVVLLGVGFELVPIGIVGAVIVFLGLWYVTAGTKRTPKVAAGGPKKPSPSSSSGDFMARQAQEWERRRQERDQSGM